MKYNAKHVKWIILGKKAFNALLAFTMKGTTSDTNNNTISSKTSSGHSILIELLKNYAIVWWLRLFNCSQFNKKGLNLLSSNFQ